MKPLAVYIGTINCSSSFLFFLIFLEDEQLLTIARMHIIYVRSIE